MRNLDIKYKTKSIEEWELKSLSEKNENEKFNFKFILSISLFLVPFILISPYLPSIKSSHEFNPPQNLNEYFEDIIFAAILIFSILFLTFTFDFLRNKIDEKSKIIKVGNFKIVRKVNFGRNTFIQMNNLNFLLIKSNYAGLKYGKAGQIISVKKTITNKILNLYIRDKSKFESESTTIV
jgi:hypothetical protein